MCFLGDIFLFTCLCAHIRYSITLLPWINIHTLGNDLPLPCALDPVIFPSSSQSYSSLPLTHLLFILWWVFLITIQTSYLFFHFKIILFIFLSIFNLAYLSFYRKTPWKTYLYQLSPISALQFFFFNLLQTVIPSLTYLLKLFFSRSPMTSCS